MFKQRLLTTLLLVPLVLAMIYYAHYGVLGGLITLLTLGCGMEWLQLIPIHSLVLKGLFLTLLLLAIYLIQSIVTYWLFAGLVLWILVAICIIQFPKSQRLWGRSFIVGMFCLVLLPLFAESMKAIFLLPRGQDLIVYLLCLVWAADIGAYIAGKLCGRHKLIPNVSPGKTYEGFAGGLILSLFVAVVGYYAWHPLSCLNWFGLAIVVAFISLLGDLLISMLKRRSQIKDTGSLLPGHGGILDRLDSLIAAAPLFYCGLLYLPLGL